MKKAILFFVILLLLPLSLHAGKNDKMRAANWCFGHNAMIDFSTGAPVSKAGCKISTSEGVASMSDTGGNLLLYTDGNMVYNSQHLIIENGQDLFGHKSSSQSAIIFPVPGDTTKYYIATVDVIGFGFNPNPNHHGMNYSIVDMAANNGLGKVTEKNILLSPTVCEKLTAVGHANGEDYWLVTQVWGKNIIQVFLVDKDGINLKHEFATTIFEDFDYLPRSVGYIKFSPDATMLASANLLSGLFLYDFDNLTGELSNERGWRDGEFTNSYGVEFSLSGRFLYVATTYTQMNVCCLFQLDLLAGTNKEIENSMVILKRMKEPNLQGTLGALQLSIDGKIYSTKAPEKEMGIINNIDSKGTACNYDDKGFALQYGTMSLGLPQMIQSFFNIKPGTVDYDDCEGGAIVLDAEEKSGYSYNWTGPQGLNVNTAHHEINPTTREHSGTYTLTVTAPDGTKKTFDYNITIKYLDLDVALVNNADVTSNKNAKSTTQYLSIKNNTPFDVVIDNAYLEKGDKFKLNPVALPLTIAANTTSTTDISYYLFSDETGIFSDSLIVEVAEPCEDRIATYMKGIVSAKPKIEATADDCERGRLTLEVEENKGYTYNWKGPEGLDVDTSYYTKKPTSRAHSGTYTLTITAPDGTQTTYDYDIEIKYVDIRMVFETHEVTTKENVKSKDFYLHLYNDGEYATVISDVFVYGGKFKINPVSLPFTIAPYSPADVDISYYLLSEEAGDFNGSIGIKTSLPCDLSQYASFVGHVTKAEPIMLYIQLPDTTAEVGQVIRMPLKARLSHPLDSMKLADINLTWHYLADVYSPMYYQTFTHEKIFADTIDPNNEYITGHFKNIALDTTYKKIADISGYALLSKYDSTPLSFDIDSAYSNISIPNIIIVPENGSLTVTKPACISPDIVMNPDITHAASPAMMPISDDATIKLYSPDAGELKLTVYSITGQMIEQFSYINGNEPLYKEITLDLNKYANGVYCLTWQSKQRTFNKTVIIKK